MTVALQVRGNCTRKLAETNGLDLVLLVWLNRFDSCSASQRELHSKAGRQCYLFSQALLHKVLGKVYGVRGKLTGDGMTRIDQ